MKVLSYKNVEFDCFALDNQDGQSYYWASICPSCTEKYGFKQDVSDGASEESICGVNGCENRNADYIDFDDNFVEVRE